MMYFMRNYFMSRVGKGKLAKQQLDRYRESIKKFRKLDNGVRCNFFAITLGIGYEKTFSQASCDLVMLLFRRIFENMACKLDGINEYMKPGQVIY